MTFHSDVAVRRKPLPVLAFARTARWRASAALVTVVLLLSAAAMSRADCTLTNVGLSPLPDLGVGFYQDFQGGLYPNGSNARPPMHEADGLRIASEEIVPRDNTGNADTNGGKIVILSLGMSNTTQEWASGSRDGADPEAPFKPRADADPSKHPALIVVDGAMGGQDAPKWTNYNADTWNFVQTNRLPQAGVTTNQVQILWIKQALANPSSYGAFPAHAQRLQSMLEQILRVASQRYPNLKIAYLSSRTRAYVSDVGLNPEPYAFESAFSVQWLIEKQINGQLNYDTNNGPVVAPWLSWGPYLWANGLVPRSDRFIWECADTRENEFTHPSSRGVRKVADQLLAFFKTDLTATPWFLRKTVIGQAPVCSPVADVTNGIAPLVVNFAANANDPDGTIREIQWTFEDGTFSTNSNPTKIFSSPGVYRARVCVTDNNGNTSLGLVGVTVEANPSQFFSNPAVWPGGRSAVISWQTLAPATAQVEYGTTTNYGSVSSIQPTLQLQHSVLISGLETANTYHFRLLGLNGNNEPWHSGDYRFSTAGEIIVDNVEAALNGAWSTGVASDQYGSNYYYTASAIGNGTNTARFRPHIAVPGKYDLYEWHPVVADASTNVTVNVGGLSARINQASNGGAWTLITTNRFVPSGTNMQVRVINTTGESNKLVLADALRLAYRTDQEQPPAGTVPDWWAFCYFATNATNINLQLDDDGDGYPTWMEYLLGTDPTDPGSRLHIRLERENGWELIFSPFQAGRAYQWQSTTNLAAPQWTPLTNAPLTMNAEGEARITISPPSTSPVFFRISTTWSP